MAQSPLQRISLFFILVGLLALTRSHVCDVLPDASWAIFFLAGFWLSDAARWAFPLIMTEAVLVDFTIIAQQHINFWHHACVSPAYGCLIAAYGALWLGGRWLANQPLDWNLPTLGRVVLALLISEATCYLISNGSFYWLGTRLPTPRHFNAWWNNLTEWYLPFLKTTTLYVGSALSAYILVRHVRAYRSTSSPGQKPSGTKSSATELMQ